MRTILLVILPLVLLDACRTAPSDAKRESTQSETPGDSILFNLNDPDSSLFPKAVVTEAYVSAIAEYLKAAYSEDRSVPDTLFVGTKGVGFQFPNIELPATINKTNIRLLTFEEAERIRLNRKTYVFLNVVGWMQKDQAEFIIVTFFAGGKPQHNCFLNLSRHDKNEFRLESLRFEYPYPKNE